MTYHKPEVLPLGQASVLIQGTKNAEFGEGGNMNVRKNPADAELDD